MPFVNFGTRNKGAFFEYLSGYSFLKTQHPDTDFSIDSFFAFGEGMPNKHYQDQRVIETYIQHLFWKEFQSGIYTKQFFDRLADVYLSQMKHLEISLGNKDLQKCSPEELADLCSIAVVCGSSTLKPMLQGMFMMYLAPEFEEKLRSVLTPAEQKDAPYILETMTLLLTDPRENFLDREETALRNIENEFWGKYRVYSEEVSIDFMQQSEVNTAVNALVQDFGWFHMEYMQDPFTLKEYKDEIVRRIKIGINSSPLPAAVKDEIQKKQEIFFSSHPKSEEFERLTKVIHGFSHVYDESKVILVRDNFLMRPLLEEIAHRLGISWSEILYLVPPEVVALLRCNEKADKNLIQSRVQHRAILLREGIITWYEGEKAVLIARSLLPKEEGGDLGDSVKGTIAFPGVVRGRVRVIRSGKEAFTPGDILVTHDGTAELTLFLKQASAIVTNEGGMICHCSIVAREVKTPCIVGTKNATKIFKDGDMIEVDATQGIAKLI